MFPNEEDSFVNERNNPTMLKESSCGEQNEGDEFKFFFPKSEFDTFSPEFGTNVTNQDQYLSVFRDFRSENEGFKLKNEEMDHTEDSEWEGSAIAMRRNRKSKVVDLDQEVNTITRRKNKSKLSNKVRAKNARLRK